MENDAEVEFDDVESLEPFTKEQTQALVNAFGSVAMPIITELGNIDYGADRGVLKNNDRCMWTNDGKRITVRLGIIRSVSISSTPDPYYTKIIEEKENGE